MREHRYHVYIVASRSKTLYIGMTSALTTRIHQHKDSTYDGFSRQYNCNRLVYLETHDFVANAINREKQLKRWSRTKKLALIDQQNPAWIDLSKSWVEPIEMSH